MGECRFCGKSAGLFRSVHQDCTRKHEALKREVIVAAREVASGQVSPADFRKELDRAGTMIRLTPEDRKAFVIAAWDAAVSDAFEDGLLSVDEETRLEAILSDAGLEPKDINKNGTLTKVLQGRVLREITEGRIPQVEWADSSGFNLQKGERIAWLFPVVEYFKMKSVRHYEAGSHGVSIRIARGVYYRVGSVKGRSVSSDELVNMGLGMLAVTQRHLYWSAIGGDAASFRVPYKKLVAIEPLSDGLEVHRDGASAKPEVFKTGDPWFIYNLVMNIKELD